MTSSRPAGPRQPTLEDVARSAGVSRATVSRVVNGTRNVDPEIQRIVQEAVAATGYVPNRAARTLVTRRTDSVALVFSVPAHRTADDPFLGQVFSDPFFGRVVGGLLTVLRPRGVHPVLMLADSEDARHTLVANLRQEHIDGVALVSIAPGDSLPFLLTEAGLPTVLFARPSTPIPISYVDVAQQAGARLAAERLLARGCRRITTVAGPFDSPAGQDRLAGFRAAMAEHGHAYVPSVEGSFTQVGGERAMRELLERYPDTDGVFVANDLMAQGALLVLRDQGRRVPEDVAVIGFDDSSAALASRPLLTTIRQPVEDMAAEMARLLMALIDDPSQQTRSVIFKTSLVERDSA
ncbi:LacI family DNA-binding transcriptional regulator [Actinacidiphila bryophytorum]|uniref:HTH-type transcriptional regulator CelR n=1 Tax=Actinacidiphila bryophytorum TaxID=1436133 RepID=A0A9W4MKS5_9ACTN|nr:LacI family DNA-binding transcriptional regulator [Actinacidiphila bryophytorum]MBM9437523.1 LacI family DNA-binding transcriptional regulator [Actinacidiphila bryophytorum]MBN6544908.1 LacI family DNA-binding transcriptional regulator [Actinacidiphila bryophytorum]UWE09637.1 LacI family transcriptional regulator [Actinacidiphila bryophytorum]CAG7656066.1 HTH-type transcriptional regulator CelR [Actinacidiphila bryophytorum]